MYLKTKIECIRDRSMLFFQKIYMNVHNTLLDILYSTIIVKDINECSISNGGCEEICTNTNGSFICSCQHQEYMSHTHTH